MDFKIITPHDPEVEWHGWFFPNGWRGIGPVAAFDRAGRAAGSRKGIFPDWFVLMCNNPGCPGRAIVPVSTITDLANDRDEAVTS